MSIVGTTRNSAAATKAANPADPGPGPTAKRPVRRTSEARAEDLARPGAAHPVHPHQPELIAAEQPGRKRPNPPPPRPGPTVKQGNPPHAQRRGRKTSLAQAQRTPSSPTEPPPPGTRSRLRNPAQRQTSRPSSVADRTRAVSARCLLVPNAIPHSCPQPLTHCPPLQSGLGRKGRATAPSPCPSSCPGECHT